MKVVKHALPVAFLVVGNARVRVAHAEAHGVVEEIGEFPGGGGDCLGLAHARRQSPEKGTDNSLCLAGAHGCVA